MFLICSWFDLGSGSSIALWYTENVSLVTKNYISYVFCFFYKICFATLMLRYYESLLPKFLIFKNFYSGIIVSQFLNVCQISGSCSYEIVLIKKRRVYMFCNLVRIFRKMSVKQFCFQKNWQRRRMNYYKCASTGLL